MKKFERETVFLTRQMEFSAAHRLYREDFSEEKNREVYGLCANPYGHGHNYNLEVTVRGVPDPVTGLIIHFHQLKKMLEEVVVAPLDHHHLNHDVVFLEGVIPTSENLVRALWKRLALAFSNQPFELHQLRLSDSRNNWVDYFGG